MFCIECGQKLPDKAKFCSNCGEKVLSEDQPVTPTIQKSHISPDASRKDLNDTNISTVQLSEAKIKLDSIIFNKKDRLYYSKEYKEGIFAVIFFVAFLIPFLVLIKKDQTTAIISGLGDGVFWTLVLGFILGVKLTKTPALKLVENIINIKEMFHSGVISEVELDNKIQKIIDEIEVNKISVNKETFLHSIALLGTFNLAWDNILKKIKVKISGLQLESGEIIEVDKILQDNYEMVDCPFISESIFGQGIYKSINSNEYVINNGKISYVYHRRKMNFTDFGEVDYFKLEQYGYRVEGYEGDYLQKDGKGIPDGKYFPDKRAALYVTNNFIEKIDYL